MHQFEPLGTVQRPRQHTQPVKVVEQIILDVVEAGLDLPHTLALHAKGDEFAFGQAIIAFGKLLTQHLRILGTNIIKPIPLEWDADAFFKLGAIRCHVDERQLELNAGIEEVQKAAPFLENCSLIFLLCQLVIDVLIGNALPFNNWLIFGAVCLLIIIVPRSAARDEAIAYVRAANAAHRI